MKRYLGIAGLILLIITGITLVYLEAVAIDLTCIQAEIWCEIDCIGSLSYGDCWQYGAHTYCYFYCHFTGDCYHWSGAQSPVYAVCTFD